MKSALIKLSGIVFLTGGMFLVYYIYHLIPENVWYNHPTAMTLVWLWGCGAVYFWRYLLTGK